MCENCPKNCITHVKKRKNKHFLNTYLNCTTCVVGVSYTDVRLHFTCQTLRHLFESIFLQHLFDSSDTCHMCVKHRRVSDTTTYLLVEVYVLQSYFPPSFLPKPHPIGFQQQKIELHTKVFRM